MRQIAQCGTDAGYYRHLRITKTEACAACKKAHNEHWHMRKKEPRGDCPCGTPLRTDHEHCSRCRRKLDRAAARQQKDEEANPKVVIAWVRKGAVLRPVFADRRAA